MATQERSSIELRCQIARQRAVYLASGSNTEQPLVERKRFN